MNDPVLATNHPSQIFEHCVSMKSMALKSMALKSMAFTPLPVPRLLFALLCVLSLYGGSVSTKSTFGSEGSISRQSPR
jgi:hypothetical protein